MKKIFRKIGSFINSDRGFNIGMPVIILLMVVGCSALLQSLPNNCHADLSHHLLRRFSSYEGNQSSGGGFFMMGVGYYKSSSRPVTTVRYMYERATGLYAVSETEVENIQFVFDEPNHPYIIIDQSYCGRPDLTMITIHCSESDMPVQLDFNNL